MNFIYIYNKFLRAPNSVGGGKSLYQIRGGTGTNQDMTISAAAGPSMYIDLIIIQIYPLPLAPLIFY